MGPLPQRLSAFIQHSTLRSSHCTFQKNKNYSYPLSMPPEPRPCLIPRQCLRLYRQRLSCHLRRALTGEDHNDKPPKLRSRAKQPHSKTSTHIFLWLLAQRSCPVWIFVQSVTFV